MLTTRQHVPGSGLSSGSATLQADTLPMREFSQIGNESAKFHCLFAALNCHNREVNSSMRCRWAAIWVRIEGVRKSSDMVEQVQPWWVAIIHTNSAV